MSQFLDEVARTLATPMPRRRALRAIGGALVTVAVPSTFTRSAVASTTATQACSGCGVPHGAGCVLNKKCGVDVRGSSVCCKWPGYFGRFEYGAAGGFCAQAGGQGLQPPGGLACCCPDGTTCGSPPGPVCVCQHPCGPNCCKSGEYCANAAQRLCCKEGHEGCGNRCCDPNEECVSIRTGTSSERICVARCPQGRARCGKDKCCPKNWRCANPSTGLCKRCGRNEEECERKCCDKRTSRCCGKAGCCPKSRSCCVTGSRQICCPPRHECAVPILAGNIGTKPGTPAICCPNDRLNRQPKLCCPPGMVALNSPGFRTPPPGVPPDCCPRSQVCRSGGRNVCVDLQSDPRNCGSCGNVCESGVCNGGICALP